MKKQKLVILTGAGISAESGLKTFRDSDGLWEGYNVYEVATPRGFAANPKLVLDFYNMRRKDVAAAKPNAAHIGLADLENFFDVTIITQNIDDLRTWRKLKCYSFTWSNFEMRSVKNDEEIFTLREIFM
jgi:NAD-dependent deacetylase